MDNKKLHLFGKDKEDYKIFSSLLQDAAVPISEIKFDGIRNQFFFNLFKVPLGKENSE